MNLLKKISIVCVTVLAISYFIPVQTTKNAVIKKTFYDVVSEINNPDNWKKWYSPIKSSYQKHPEKYRFVEDYKNKKFIIYTHNNQYEVTKYSPGYLKVQSNGLFKTNCEVRFTFTKDSHKSIVFETHTISLLTYVLKFFKPDNQYDSVIKNLKPFMENPSLYYGFEIKRTHVPDTIYLTLSKTILAKNRYIATDSMYKILTKYALKNKLTRTFKPYLVQNTLGNDSLTITAMLVIDTAIMPDSKITSFTMPSGGNILVARYKGRYNASKTVYDALQKYVFDNTLSSVFTPFERYLDKRIPKNDSSIVDMEVFYPIY